MALWKVAFINESPAVLSGFLFLVFSIKLHCDRAVQCDTDALFHSVGSRIPTMAVSVSFGISKVTRESSSCFI